MTKKILVVDDNPDVANSFALLLDAMGHEVRTANEGPEALELAREFEPAVAFLDIGLPVMDGFELAQRLRAQYGGRPLELVALTGSGEVVEQRGGADEFFDHYLVKPASIDDLERILSA